MKNDYTRMTQGIDVGGVGVGMGRFDPVGQREGTGDDGGGGAKHSAELAIYGPRYTMHLSTDKCAQQ